MSILMDKMDFPQWLIEQRNSRGWSQSDLSRFADVSRQVISDYEGYKRKYFDEGILTKIARAFKFPPEEVFRAAGILPPVPVKSAKLSVMDYLFDQLDEEGQADLLAIAQDKVRRKEEREARSKMKKPLPSVTKG